MGPSSPRSVARADGSLIPSSSEFLRSSQRAGTLAQVTISFEPDLTTEPNLLGILDELRVQEPIGHRPEFGTKRADFAAQLADDFWEVGASGRRYSREFVLSVLENRWSRPHEDLWGTSEFHGRELGKDTYALTYTLRQPGRVTRRLTIWGRVDGAWKALFHQGTVVAA